MPGRKYSSGTQYRYGFNRKENDNEVKGEGNQQDYGMRIYDPRLGRFLSVDPITSDYPDLTPYQFASNTPIWAIDLDGLEGFVNTGVGVGQILTPENANKVVKRVGDIHRQGIKNVEVTQNAKSQAIKQGRVDGDGITWLTFTSVYIAPWWNRAAPYSDANDGSVFLKGKNLDGTEATKGDYVAAGIAIFAPFISGKVVKEYLTGFSLAIEGYNYGGKTFENAQEFGKAVVELGGKPRDKRALIETVTRQAAETNGWKKSNLSGTILGEEVYELGNGSFGSVDKYHGNFEIFQKKGNKYEHQGSIDIDGVKNKERNSKYDVKF